MSAVQQVIYEVSSVIGSAALIGTWRVGVKGIRSLRDLHGRLDTQDQTLATIKRETTKTATDVRAYTTKLDDHLVEEARARGLVEGQLRLLTNH